MKKVRFTFLFTVLFLAGCWDSVKLEERAFIVGTALDFAEDAERKQNEAPTLEVTNQIVIPSGIGFSNMLGGSSTDKPFMNVTSVGKSIYSLDKEVFAKTNKIPYYEHFLLLIISEEMAKKEYLLPKLLDSYIRDPHVRRATKVVIAKDDAHSILNFKTDANEVPIIFLDELLEQNEKHAGFLKPIVLGELEEFHLQNNSYVLPYVELDEQIENKRGAVFHGQEQKMVGTLNANELQGLAILMGEAKENIVDFTLRDEALAFEIDSIRRNITVDPSNVDQIKISYELYLRGSIRDSASNLNFDNPYTVAVVEHLIREKINEVLKQTITKAQKELEADIFGIWRQLEMKHYQTWLAIKDDWEHGEKYFPKASFTIDTEINLYSVGTSNKTN